MAAHVNGLSEENHRRPEAYVLDTALLARLRNNEIQLDRFLDYARKVAFYSKFHEYFGHQATTVTRGLGPERPFFPPAGAEAFLRHSPNPEVHFYDTGRFALETHSREIAAASGEFLGRPVAPFDSAFTLPGVATSS